MESLLITPDFAPPLIVQTDASEVGLGGVLSQVRAGEEHPITYFSRELLRAKPLYGIKGGPGHQVEPGRVKVLSPREGVYPGHRPRRDTNARVTPWFLALQDFGFKVDHRPGREHGNACADALSRRDTCLGGFPVYLRPEQAVEECGIPPLKPRPGRVRAVLLDGVYRRHPLTGHREHHFSLPNQRDGEHLTGGRTRPGSHPIKRIIT